MVARIEKAYEDTDTLGGTIEVIAYGLPPGLGSHMHWDRKLDTRLAAACMSVQAMKGVEIGEGFALASTPGSLGPRRDPAVRRRLRAPDRSRRRAGGRDDHRAAGPVRVAMKPLSSLPRPLRTVDMDTHEPAEAITQRSDTCAVPRAGVVLEHVVAYELADALLEKTGGDTVDEVKRNLAGYLDAIADR
jgi:chorismate synthase